MNYSSMLNRLTGIKREQMQCAVSSKAGIKTITNDKAGKMYQIQVRGYAQTTWVNWHRPWLTKDMAAAAMEAVIKADDESGNHGLYVYQIVEV